MPSLSRRDFLRHAGLVSVATAGAGWLTPTAAEAAEWQNWSGWQKARPVNLAYPGTEDELARLVRNATQIRAVGGSHSFSPVVPTNGTIVSLEALNGLVRHDASAHTATAWGGTRIAALGPALRAIGQGLINEADINMQSLAGAISTATHGTGRTLQCYSAYVRELRLVLADGSIVDCSANKNTDLFQAARVGVGSVGVISQITLQNRTAYRLHESVGVMNLDDAMALLTQEKDKNRHIEFFAFPYGQRAIVKRTNLTSEAVTPAQETSIDENELLDFAADTARKYPWANKTIQRLVGLFLSDNDRVGESADILASTRTVGFNEMEYSVPVEHGMACFREVIETIRKKNIQVFFPIEFRYIAADDCWLSPFQGRDSVAISVHQYHKQDYHELFSAVEPIFWKYGGRPHWGKLHTLRAKQLRALYPHFDDFVKVRATADPQQKFLNAHARKLFIG